MKLTTRLLKGLCLLYVFAYTQLNAQNNCNTNCSIQCIGQINVSLDQNCSTEITPAMGAVGVEYYCNPYYTVNLYDQYGYALPEPVVGIEYNGETLTYKVTENQCGNSCWGTVLIEYKYPPNIDCPGDLTISCGADQLLEVPPASGGCADFDVVLYEEIKQDLDCHADYASILTRTYRAFDSYGNESFCSHDIYIKRLDINSILYPAPAVISCADTLMRFDGNGIPLPWYTVPLSGSGMADGVPVICDANVTDGLLCPGTMDLSAVPLIPVGGAIAIIENPEPDGPRFIVNTIEPDNNQLLCNAFLTYTDIEIPNLPCKRKIIREWTIREWWCNFENTGGAAQLISIVDDQPPQFDCPSDFTVSTDANCGGNVYIETVEVYDACSGIPDVRVQHPNGTLFGNGGYINLNLGHNTLTYIVSDGCYNQSTCEVEVTVEDRQAPVAICESFKVVSMNTSSTVHVFAEPFDNGSFDECGLDRFEVRRMDSLCVASDTLFGESVSFCCSDVGTEVMVVFRAYDWNQNFNDCMVRVEVQDKIAPRITCPPDQTIQCQDAFDLSNLSNGFGEADISDNCAGSQLITEDVQDNVNQCGIGTLVRVLSVIDPDSVVQAFCKQVITIENNSPFIGANIQWPMDYVAEGVCEIENIDPEDLPEFFDVPRFSGQDECSLLGYQYEDKIFESANGCAHIKRTWRVINWCGTVNGQYDIWTIPQPQLIEIVNTTAPVIAEQDDQAYESQDINCGGDSIQVIRTATDDCEFLGWYHVVTDAQGDTLVAGLSDTLNVYLPVGEYTVEWIVRDGCGNFDVDYQELSMVNTKAPTPVCINGLSASLVGMDLDSNGVVDAEMVEIWAEDFDSGSSFSCGNGITFSFSSDTTDKFRIYDCDDIGRNPVQMWVTDIRTGYQDFCTSFIDIQDNNAFEICPDSIGMKTIVGDIYTEDLRQVSSVEVSLGENVPVIATDASGHYDFGGMPFGGHYVIEPSKNDDHLNGVTTLDLILIQRHILGLDQLDSPYRLLAADVNSDAKLSALDLIELRKLILGIYNTLPANESWRFVDAAYRFLDEQDPWYTPYPESYAIDFLLDDMQVDFIGMKTGDVNGSVTAGTNKDRGVQARSSEKLVFHYSRASSNWPGESRLVLSAENYNDILGWQMEWNFDPSQLTVKAILPHLMDLDENSDVFIDNKNGIIRFSYASELPQSFDQEDVLFEILLEREQSHISGEMFPFELAAAGRLTAEAYDEAYSLQDIELISGNASPDARINTVIPNPWSQSARLSYELDRPGVVRWEMFDVTGRRVFETSRTHNEAGVYFIDMERSQINARGMIYVKMTTEETIAEYKMLILD